MYSSRRIAPDINAKKDLRDRDYQLSKRPKAKGRGFKNGHATISSSRPPTLQHLCAEGHLVVTAGFVHSDLTEHTRRCSVRYSPPLSHSNSVEIRKGPSLWICLGAGSLLRQRNHTTRTSQCTEKHLGGCSYRGHISKNRVDNLKELEGESSNPR